MTFDDSNSSILYPEISMDHDLYKLPNVIEFIYSEFSSAHETESHETESHETKNPKENKEINKDASKNLLFNTDLF